MKEGGFKKGQQFAYLFCIAQVYHFGIECVVC